MKYIDEELVGFDDDADYVIKKLTSGTRDLDIIPIVGMAGLGKTSLARMIYCSPIVCYHFDVKAFCCISQTYNVRKLLLEILRQTRGRMPHNADEDNAADALRKFLMCKRYLIILDDIWEVGAWEELRGCFPTRHACGSRIILTTRVTEVAKFSYASDLYFLPFLKDEESWELLQKKVFRGESCPPELLNVGQLVAQKCKGLPFMIIMVAGSILEKAGRDPELWLKVAYDISSHALEEESKKIIQLSYNCLEEHLKSCLLYMALFPKDYEIPVSDLLKCWMAEEFVSNVVTLKLEETSKSCLNGLVNRNLVMVSKRGTDGEMKYCRVLDHVREFCLSKIREDKFKQLIMPYNPCQPVHSDELRLCMYINETMKSDKVPTLSSRERESFGEYQGSLEFIAHPKFSISDRKNLFPLLNTVRLIRVLYLLDIYLQDSWAVAMQSLTHLRYLAIFVKAFDIKWVSHLLHLQTLQVRSSYIMISAVIWKMAKLRHVDISEFSIGWEDNERVKFKENSEIVLDNLKSLGMCYMSVADMTPEFWAKFPALEELRLHINEFGDVPNYSDGYASYLDFPSSLKVLSISDIFLTEEIVSSIARLQHLETLKLSEIYFTGKKHWHLNTNVFNALKVLKLHRVFMTQWHFSDESFPVLERLVLKSCSKLEEIPDSLSDIVTLQLVKLIDCSDSAENWAEKIREEREDFGDMGFQLYILKESKSVSGKYDSCASS